MKKQNKILLTILTLFTLFTIAVFTFVANFIFSNKEYYKHEKNIAIPIFLYHDIVSKKTAEDFMQTTDTVFKKQISGLSKFGYSFIGYDDLIAYNNGKKKLKSKVALITFDDGLKGNYDTLFPIVKELNIPITINVIDSEIGKEGYLNWEQIKEMHNSGLISIHSHGKSHIKPFDIETEQYTKDVLFAHKNIEEHLGKAVAKVYTYPYGLYEDKKIEALAKEGFVQNLTDNKINRSDSLDLSRLHRQYPLNDSVFIILLKTLYRDIRY